MRPWVWKAAAAATLAALVWASAPDAVVDGATHDIVKFRTEDNVWVHADLYTVKKGKREPIVLLFHQAGSNGRAEYAYHIPKLIENGYNVLVVDQRSGGSQFGGENRTVEGESGKQYSYCEVYPDLEAALEFVEGKGYSGSRFAWGSSYSAALVLRLGMEHPDELAGVLSFSPAVGSVMDPCSTTVYVTNIEIPAFVAVPSFEVAKHRGMAKRSNRKLAAASADYVDRMYVAEPAVHGASMLDPGRVDGDVSKHWDAVLGFMQSNR
ncbi:MAG: alpha/beta hydrolase [Candidatus Latescibacterota bacterium]|jgi:alpha-beta hydrolase superfamily lysophospholipase